MAATTTPTACRDCGRPLWGVRVAGDMPVSAQADAFAALQHIEDGNWDRFLLRLRSAIDKRRYTEEYVSHIVMNQPLFSGGSDDE